MSSGTKQLDPGGYPGITQGGGPGVPKIPPQTTLHTFCIKLSFKTYTFSDFIKQKFHVCWLRFAINFLNCCTLFCFTFSNMDFALICDWFVIDLEMDLSSIVHHFCILFRDPFFNEFSNIFFTDVGRNWFISICARRAFNKSMKAMHYKTFCKLDALCLWRFSVVIYIKYTKTQ